MALPNYVSKSEFARMAGVTPATVTKLVKARLSAAVVGRKIDADHPGAVAYLQKRAGTPAVEPPAAQEKPEPAPVESKPAPEKKPGRPKGSGKKQPAKGGWNARKAKQAEEWADQAGLPAANPAEHPVPQNLEPLADMTLRQLVARFGTDVRFNEWLKALQTMAMIVDRQLRNEEKAGRLVNRELVHKSVIDVFDSVHRRMMTDGAKNIAATAVAKLATGAPQAKIEAEVSDVIGSFIKPAKKKIQRFLKNAS